MPFDDSGFDLITAFETIQFWPELDRNLKSVCHKLKAGGIFLIANRLPREGTKWHHFAQIKNIDEYKQKLNSAGFPQIITDVKTKPGWIIVIAQKKKEGNQIL